MKKVGVLLYDDVLASAVTGVLDVLNEANRQYQKQNDTQDIAFSWQLIGIDKKYINASQNLVFKADVWLEDCPPVDVLIWPATQYHNDQDLWQLCQALTPFHSHIRKLTEQAKLVMSGCTSVALLANTGMLAGKKITTSWWLDSFFQRYIKGCQLDTSAMLRIDDQYITCGATSSFMLLTWYLVRSSLGAEVAGSVARHLLIDTDQIKQTAFFALSELPDHHDPELKELTQWIHSHLASDINVSAMAYKLNVSERTLTRRFKKQLGLSPMQYVQIARIEKACVRLKATDKTAQEIASELGYQDDAAFRKLFLKHLGVGMGEYRRKKEW